MLSQSFLVFFLSYFKIHESGVQNNNVIFVSRHIIMNVKIFLYHIYYVNKLVYPTFTCQSCCGCNKIVALVIWTWLNILITYELFIFISAEEEMTDTTIGTLLWWWIFPYIYIHMPERQQWWMHHCILKTNLRLYVKHVHVHL